MRLWRYCCRVSAHWRHGFGQKPLKACARLQTRPSCSPSVLPAATLLLWSSQRCEPELVQVKQNPQGTIWFTASPYEQPWAELWRSRGLSWGGNWEPSAVTGVTRLRFMKPQPPEPSTLHLGGSDTHWVPTQGNRRTAFSQARCLLSCSAVGLCPTHPPRSAYPQNLVPCSSPSVVLILMPSPPSLPAPSALSAANKAPAMPINLALACSSSFGQQLFPSCTAQASSQLPRPLG